jgi:hypothetical protein
MRALVALALCLGLLSCEEQKTKTSTPPAAEATVKNQTSPTSSEIGPGENNQEGASRSWSAFVHRHLGHHRTTTAAYRRPHRRHYAATRAHGAPHLASAAGLPYNYRSKSRSYDLGGEEGTDDGGYFQERDSGSSYDYEAESEAGPYYKPHRRRHHRMYSGSDGYGPEYASAPMSINSPEYFDPWAGYGVDCPYLED